jgi:hypothetical protein
MATIQGLVSVRFIDAYGITGSTDYFITADDTKTIAQLMTDVGTLASNTEALSQANEYRTQVTLIQDPGTSPVPGAGDIEKGGLFNFSNTTDDYKTGYLIPDINPAVLNSAGLIDLTNADVTTWITYLTTAHTVITVVTKGVRALSGLVDALISFRKHRKPLARKTKEVS